MMKRTILALATAAVVLPTATSAQIGLAGRVGTLGLGGEAAIALGDRLVLRGGIGLMPYEPTVTIDDLEVSLNVPTVYNVGLDLYVNGAMRLGGGVLFRRSDPEVTGTFLANQEIGGTEYTPQEIGTLTGVLDSGSRAFYGLVGFGRHTATGIGLFIDVGFAVFADPDVTLASSGGTLSDDPTFRSALDREASEFEDDMRGYLKLWPILSLGLRLGVY